MDGSYWDEYTFALYRETWEEWRPVIMPRVLAGETFVQPEGAFVPTRDWPATMRRQAGS